MKRIIAAMMAAVLLAACGSTSPKRTTLVHPCTTSNFYMQCVGTPAEGKNAPPLTSSKLADSIFGTDFAWGGPTGSYAKRLGAHFGASYLSGTSKDWSYDLARSYVNAGLGVVFVWETSADRSLDGYSAGYDDAYNATHEANRLGFKTGHINFASDFDTTFYGRRFEPYYEGAAAWDRRVGFSTGAYGGLHTVAQLCNDHITTLNWQTVAWSSGERVSSACAPLYQQSINNWLGGLSVDFDRAYATNYGQSNNVPAPVPAIVCFGKHAQGNATCARVHAEIRGYTAAVSASQRAYAARGCVRLVAARGVLQQRWSWFSTHLKKYPTVKRTSRKRALANTSRALNSVRRTITGRGCVVFAGRASYYAGLIQKLEREYA